MLKDIEQELAEILLDNVLSKKGKPTYKEVAIELEKRLGRPVNAHYSLSYPLGKVSSICYDLGLPLISARVIHSTGINAQVIGGGFYEMACELKPHYKTMSPIEAWKAELQLIRDCQDWYKLRNYLDGISTTKEPATAAFLQKDIFANWLKQTTTLKDSSIDKYARAVKTISQEMVERSVITKALHRMSAFELDIALGTIMKNDYFVDKNTRGNHMYSNALKQYRYFMSLTVEPDDCVEYLESIKQNTTISETERTAIVQSRIGQGQFRKQLMDKYKGSCVITGINHPKLLVASHIKPWAASDNQERLQVDNGLLLSATYDRLFDSGLITFDKNGRIFLSSFIGMENEKKLHLQAGIQYPLLVTNKMQQFLEYHSDVVFVK